jgi:hypothetical protein
MKMESKKKRMKEKGRRRIVMNVNGTLGKTRKEFVLSNSGFKLDTLPSRLWKIKKNYNVGKWIQ